MKNLMARYRYSLILLRELVKTDFKLRYQGSILGIAWSVLKPLMLFVVMYLVFVEFLRFTDGTHTYPIVLLLGIALWGFFAEATGVGMQSIVARGDLLRKVNFPRYIVVVSAICSSMISLLINMGIVIVALALYVIFGQANFSWDLLWLPLNLLEFIAIALGIALFLSALFVKFRDITHIWDVILQILFYAMPVIYPLTLAAFTKYPIIAKLMMMNPVAQTIQDVRHNLISPTVPTVWSVTGHWFWGLIPIAIAIGVLALGIWFFRRNSKHFAEDL